MLFFCIFLIVLTTWCQISSKHSICSLQCILFCSISLFRNKTFESQMSLVHLLSNASTCFTENLLSFRLFDVQNAFVCFVEFGVKPNVLLLAISYIFQSSWIDQKHRTLSNEINLDCKTHKILKHSIKKEFVLLLNTC